MSKRSVVGVAGDARRSPATERQSQDASNATGRSVSAGIAVRLVTAQARTWMTQYFPRQRRADRLPLLLEDWVEQHRRSFGVRDRIPEPVRPLIMEREGRKLVVRLVIESNQAILTLTEERTAIDRRWLEGLGLTQREVEVAGWMVEGKTNAEIGQILGIHPVTVKKHVEHIFQKLGVENRTAATGLVLGHHGWKPR
jgi:DNA-binding CsgD family transcriptional regulator